MGKLNLDELMNKLKDTKSDEGFVAVASEALAENNGKIDVELSTKIEALLEEVIDGFKNNRTFNWRVHILDPIYAIVSITKLVDNTQDREATEKLVDELLKDLFKRYSPKLPYIPDFIGNFIKSMILSSLIPKVVDWLFDKIYGPDKD